MTETMIERVARALFVKTKEEASSRGIQSSWENCPIKGHYIDLARAAINAMREPTESMVENGKDSENTLEAMTDLTEAQSVRNIYHAMIDRALKD